MSRHNFESAVAEQVGVNAAVIYQNLKFWCEKNAANDKHLHDGKVWTYNSMKAFETLFPYMSNSQIRTALDKLETREMVEVGSYNRDPRDRTKWYAITDTLHLSEIANAIAPNRSPLPDSKPTYIKQTPKPPVGAADLFKAEDAPEQKNAEPADEEAKEISEGFASFWEMWPANNRKAGKISCEAVYASACKGRHPKAAKVTPAALNLAAKAYLATVKDLDFIKGTLPWLRLPGWEPFLGTTQEFYFDELTARQRGMLEDGRVPPSMMDGDMPNTAARFWLQKFGHGDAA